MPSAMPRPRILTQLADSPARSAQRPRSASVSLDPRQSAMRLAGLEDGTMRREIEIQAEGATLRGWLFTPARSSSPAPAIVMAHGFSAVKEMYLDRYAEVFSAAGMAAL